MTPLRIVVFGVPIPKGSTKAFMRPGARFPVVTHDNAKTRPWQESIVDAARIALDGAPPIEAGVAVELSIVFFLPRPKSAQKRIIEPLKKPDLDKLVRCAKDGLTRAGVYHDDSQVTPLHAEKHFAGGVFDALGPAGVPRAVIVVRPHGYATAPAQRPLLPAVGA